MTLRDREAGPTALLTLLHRDRQLRARLMLRVAQWYEYLLSSAATAKLTPAPKQLTM